MTKICARCGCECKDEYYKVLDNYLQVKYFDDEETNCFCSEDCFCEFVMLEPIYIEDEDDEHTEDVTYGEDICPT